MAMVVGLSAHGIFGLKYVPPHDLAVFTVVETTMAELAPLRFPPPTIQLEQLSRPLLLHLARHSNRMSFLRLNKAQLAQIVFDEWDTITEGLSPVVNGRQLQTVHEFFRLNPQALAPPVLPALPVARNPIDDSDASDSGSDDSAFAREIMNAHGYEGQPHRQPDLPEGWATPRTVATSDVLGEKPPSVFTEHDEDATSSVAEEMVDLKHEKVQQPLMEYAQVVHACAHDELKVNVKIMDITVPFFYKKDTTGHDLANFLDLKTNGNLHEENILLSLHGSNPPFYESLHSYLLPDDVLVVVPKVCGGGRHAVQKTFMKKADAVKALRKKAQTIYETDEDNNIPEASLPSSFNAFIQEQETALNEFLMMKTRAGYSFFALAIKHLQGDELMTLKNILNPPRALAGKTKNLTNEEKLSKSIHALFPALVKMKLCQTKLEHQQEKMMKTLMEAFVETYHTYNEGTGTINIDLQTLTNTVEGELTQRNINVPPPSEEGNSCTIQ